MAIRDKKKQEEFLNSLEESFSIPQIDPVLNGLRTTRSAFKGSTFASSIYGTGIKDETTYHDVAGEGVDVVRTYDAYRADDDKILTEEEMIRRYGTKFPEFETINLDTSEEVYGKRITLNKKVDEVKEEGEQAITNDFIETIDEVTSVGTSFGEREEPNMVGFEFDLEEDSDTPSAQITNLDEQDFFTDEQKDEMDIQEFPNIYRRTPEELLAVRRENSFDDNNEPRHEATSQAQAHEDCDDYSFFESNETVAEATEALNTYDKYHNYQYPSLSRFQKASVEDQSIPEWVKEKKEIIDDTLSRFNVPGRVLSFVKGPTFTRYELDIERGYNVRKITTFSESFQKELGVVKIRIQAPIPGKTTVGLEVPNDKADTVFFGDIFTEEFLNDGKPLNVVLGKDIDGKIVTSDIKKWPHGLVAGGTGSGKSVCINTILVSLISKNKPDDVKLVLVDPKQVELISYNNIPHLVTPVICDMKLASSCLNWCVEEMERRYSAMAQAGARNIDAYNNSCKKNLAMTKMPYIVVVIDELADLIQECGSEVEDSIQRLAQKARASGIHLILATQRPTVDVIKGTIKTNIQTRIAFRVTSQTDSFTILDEGGAETLLGRGDMLLKEIDTPIRLQGAYINDDEIDYVTEYIKDKYEPDYIFEHSDLQTKFDSEVPGSVKADNLPRELLFECAKYFVESQTSSINMLTQQFNLGYNRAARIVQALENLKVVSGKQSTKGREVLVTMKELYEIFEMDYED